MRIEKLVVGSLGTNCYLVWEDKTRQALIIDPGDDGDYIIRKIQDLRLSPKFIVATHGHFDHLLAVLEVKLAFSIPFLMNKEDLFLLKRAKGTALKFLKTTADPVPLPDQYIRETDVISFGNEKLIVLETPGHTPGGISLKGKETIFSGDTLFADGVGRTDFSYSSKKDLRTSIKRLLAFSPDNKVYPGHGEETTVAREREIEKPMVIESE